MTDLFSPGRLTRVQEKAELATLNDRLALYMSHMQELRETNASLTQQLEFMSSSSESVWSKQKALLEDELNEIRKALDKASNEKGQLETKLLATNETLANLEKEVGTLRGRAGDLAKDLEAANKARHKAESAASTEKDKATAAVARAEAADAAKADLEATIKELRERSSSETQARLEAENTIATLKDELDLQKRNYNLLQEEYMKDRRSIVVASESVRREFKDQFNARLAEALAAARSRFEVEAQAYRTEMDEFYRTALGTGITNGSSSAANDLGHMKEIGELQSKFEATQSELYSSRTLVASLHDRIKNLEASLSTIKEKHIRELGEKDAAVDTIRRQLLEKERQYKELMGVRIALDTEINQYRQLLESAESRSGLSSPATNARVQSYNALNSSIYSATSTTTTTTTTSYAAAGSSSSGAGSKRKASKEDEGAAEDESKRVKEIVFEETATALTTEYEVNGPIDITELNTDGLFAVLENSTDEEVSLSGWKLCTSLGEESSTYTIPRGRKLKPHGTLTIYTSDANNTAGADDLVWKKQSRLYCAPGAALTLLQDDEVRAKTSIQGRQAEILNPVEPTADGATKPAECVVM